MTNEIENLTNRAKGIVEEGNQRQVVLRGKSGKTLIQSSLTVVVAVFAVLTITGFLSIPLLVIGTVIAMVMGLRVELQHRTSDTVEIDV